MRYSTVVADPPWPYDGMTKPWYSGSVPSYELMPLDDIKALPVSDIAAPNAHLYVWAVLPMMAEAFDVVRSWGFRPCTALTWCKPGPGLGAGFRGNTEHLIVARRGTPPGINPTCLICGGRARGVKKCSCPAPDWRHRGESVPPPEAPFLGRARGTWYEAPRGLHSEKPKVFMELIEEMSPGPRLEMFSRAARPGWHTWGNESSMGVWDLSAAAEAAT